MGGGRGDWIKLLKSGKFGEMKMSRNLGAGGLFLTIFSIFAFIGMLYKVSVRNPDYEKINMKIKTLLSRSFCAFLKGGNFLSVTENASSCLDLGLMVRECATYKTPQNC